MKKMVNNQLVDLTDEDVLALEIAHSEYLNDILPIDVRNKRNSLLSDTDWMALSDNTMTTEMAAYRQALRDVTEQEGFPYSVTWPTKP